MTGRPAAWALHTPATLDEVNLHLAALEAAGLLGIVEQDGETVVYLPDRVADTGIDGRWEPVPDEDWSTAWRDRVQPVTVGRFTVAPPWSAAPGDLVIEPAQAFGTGHHETTAGCLATLQELDVRGRSVLDVGTGSGVLAIAAARLGAASVVAVDVDPLAVDAARGNAAVNDAAVDVRAGSVDAVTGQFDVVLANLDTATVCAVAGDLAARLAHGGTLVASGVSIERAGEAVAALGRAGVEVAVRPGREWVLLAGGRGGAADGGGP